MMRPKKSSGERLGTLFMVDKIRPERLDGPANVCKKKTLMLKSV
jgi:hypothetical protein